MNGTFIQIQAINLNETEKFYFITIELSLMSL